VVRKLYVLDLVQCQLEHCLIDQHYEPIAAVAFVIVVVAKAVVVFPQHSKRLIEQKMNPIGLPIPEIHHLDLLPHSILVRQVVQYFCLLVVCLNL